MKVLCFVFVIAAAVVVCAMKDESNESKRMYEPNEAFDELSEQNIDPDFNAFRPHMDITDKPEEEGGCSAVDKYTCEISCIKIDKLGVCKNGICKCQ